MLAGAGAESAPAESVGVVAVVQCAVALAVERAGQLQWVFAAVAALTVGCRASPRSIQELEQFQEG